MAPKGDNAAVYSNKLHKMMNLHAAFRRVAMLFMAELPSEMEYLVNESEAVAKILVRGHGIVECQSHTGEFISYIVIHNGTRYTTRTRPAWSKPEEIEIERRPLR